MEVSDGNGDAETTTEVDPELVASNIPEKEPSHCDNDGSTAAIANNNEEPAKAAFGDENKLLPGRQMIFGFMPMYVLFPSSNNEAITRSSLKSPSSSIASQQRRRSGPPSATRNNKDEDDDAASMPPPSSPGRPSYGPSSPMRPKMKEDRRRINIITNASPDLFNNRQKNNDRTTDAAAAAGEELQTAPSTTTAAAATTGATDRKPKQKQDAGTIDARPAREETASPLDLPRALPIQQRDKRQFGGYRPDLPYYDPHYGPINYGYPDYYPDYDDYDTDITIYVWTNTILRFLSPFLKTARPVLIKQRQCQ